MHNVIIILYTNSLLTSARACNRCGLLLYDAAPSNLHVPHFFIKGTVGKLLGYSTSFQQIFVVQVGEDFKDHVFLYGRFLGTK